MPQLSRRLWLISACVVVVLTAGMVRAAEPTIEFNRDVRPILSDHCFKCHGFDAKQRKAELRLDVADGALAVRDGKAAVKPRDLAASELWKRINADDEFTVMPPPETKKTLTAAQKETLKKWIEQGAPYQKHWAFEAVSKPAVPAVKNEAWVRNDIDRFVLARLERDGLSPRPEADRPTLIRRVAFALTGLPPTPKEVEQFESDRTPQAYEKMVDRYLASPRYGEEMARHWLDVARYADTHGLHLDNERTMWAYRDWVIGSFNRNQPFDQFTIDQLAGDQVPNPTQDQLIATGFNRCNVTTSEGGSIESEFLYRYAVDRTSEVIQTWMGLTGGCAVCHDHKYDPLTMREFYSMYAFFYSAADPAMDRNHNVTDPFHKIPTPDQKTALETARAAETKARAELEKLAATVEYVDPATLSTPAEKSSTEKRRVADVWLDDVFPLGSRPTCSSRNASIWAMSEVAPPMGRRALRQASASRYQDKFENATVPLVVPESATLSVWVRIDGHEIPKVVSLELLSQRATHRAFWGDATAVGGKNDDKGRLGDLPKPNEWTKLEFFGESLDLKPGDQIKSVAFTQFGGVSWWDGLQVAGEINPATDVRSSFGAWWKDRAGKDTPGVPGDLAALLKQGPPKPPEAPKAEASAAEIEAAAAKLAEQKKQEKRLRDWWLAWIARPTDDALAKAQDDWSAKHALVTTLDESIPGTFIFKDLEKPRDAFVMLRGQYDKPGEKVDPGVPEAFPKLAVEPGRRPNRLDLAKWLLTPEQPLTARVTVNRFWQQFFGTGLVKTSFDFGSQGETPSHPELLDWLSVRFQQGTGGQGVRGAEEGRGTRVEGQGTEKASETSVPGPSPLDPGPSTSWNVKALVRLLLTSAAFRQDARVSPELLKRDPENRLYARGPRFRLDAEQIRDNALFVGGLLSLKTGGRGTNPYQPPNIWEPVGYSDSNTRHFLQDHGEDLYRRSIYVFLKRTAPPPFMSNFDAPNREQFCTRRERSNTPLQALQTMNDTQHFEAARGFAERIVTEGGAAPDDRIAFAFRAALSRRPTPDELAIVRNALDQYLARYASDPAAAKKAIHVGESKPKTKTPEPDLAAWTLIANLVLNLDETITRN